MIPVKQRDAVESENLGEVLTPYKENKTSCQTLENKISLAKIKLNGVNAAKFSLVRSIVELLRRKSAFKNKEVKMWPLWETETMIQKGEEWEVQGGISNCEHV